MARISGINLPPNKHIEIALTSIYGIGKIRAQQICDGAGVVRTAKVRELTDQDAESLRAQVSEYVVEGDLRREVSMSIKRLMILAATEVCATVAAYRFVDNEVLLMPARVRAPRDL